MAALIEKFEKSSAKELIEDALVLGTIFAIVILMLSL